MGNAAQSITLFLTLQLIPWHNTGNIMGQTSYFSLPFFSLHLLLPQSILFIIWSYLPIQSLKGKVGSKDWFQPPRIGWKVAENCGQKLVAETWQQQLKLVAKVECYLLRTVWICDHSGHTKLGVNLVWKNTTLQDLHFKLLERIQHSSIFCKTCNTSNYLSNC